MEGSDASSCNNDHSVHKVSPENIATPCNSGNPSAAPLADHVGTRFVLTRAFLDDNAVISDFKLADGTPAGWRLREALPERRNR